MAIKRGQEPTAEAKAAHKEYERLRWTQLPPAAKAGEISKTNTTRKERERIWGRRIVTPRQRAVVQLIRLHLRQFERLLEEEEAKEAMNKKN